MKRVLLVWGLLLCASSACAGEKWPVDGATHRWGIEVKANGVERIGKIVEVELGAEERDGVRFQSLQLVEVDERGRVVDDAVPFQFEPGKGAPQGQIRGTLILLMQGRTAAEGTRHYQLYWRSGEKPFTAAAVPSYVTVTDKVMQLDLECFRIQTRNATYIYGKDGAGFASILDRDRKDWISYSHVPKAAGEYRGLPKFGHPEKLFHAGYKGFVSTITQQGPLKVQIYSEHTDGKSACTWDFYPTYATVTLHKFKLPTYWFLYEGTPGGKLDVEEDFVVRANGKKTPLSEPWTDNVPWVYFGAGEVDHALFMAAHQKHDKVDSYVAWPFQREADGSYQQMTVFGFGRKGYKELVQHVADLSELPARYTIGFTDQIEYERATKVIESAYRGMETKVGVVEVRGR